MIPPRAVKSAIGLVACALIILQITFTRLIGYKLFYHFVFLAIALSLLGLGAAGSWVAVRPTKSADELDRSISRWLAALALLIPLSLLALANPVPIRDDGLRALKLIEMDAVHYLMWCSLFMVALNFAGGVVLARAFRAYSAHMGSLYARDLIGAGLGCLASVALMKLGTPPIAFVLSAAPVFVAWILVGRREKWSAIAAVVGMLLAISVFALPDRFKNFENFRRKKPPVPVLKYEWDHLIRTDHIDGAYVLDGDASTPTVIWDEKEKAEPVTDPAYLLTREKPRVAIIGFGGGPQLSEARRAHAESIFGVEINGTIARWVKEDDRALNRDLFLDPSIELAVGEGRHVLSSSGRTFDLIVMHAIDTWSASAAGAYTLTENFLYTKEAIQAYLDALSGEGVVSIRRWIFNPPRENMRLFVTAIEALKERGVAHPEDHLAVLAPISDFSQWKNEARIWGFLMISKRPLTPELVDRLREHAKTQGWSILYAPGENAPTAFTAYVAAEDRAAFRATYPYLISPVTDANPYLFQYYNPLSKSAYAHHADWAVSAISQTSAILLPASLLISLLLSFLLILLPLILTKSRATIRMSWRRIIYFAGLGIGFMALEVPLTQLLGLYLGHPTYSFSVVLVALLISSGVGSLMVERISLKPFAACALVAVILALVALTAHPLIRATIHWPDAARFIMAIVMVAFCGLPMGLPLALAIRAMRDEDSVPWAWAINGATSVVGSCLVMMIMVFAGSPAALGLGAICYAAAAIAAIDQASALRSWRVPDRS